jgi:UDP-2,3-diacylglucosamine pyrophosphatase LpxH
MIFALKSEKGFIFIKTFIATIILGISFACLDTRELSGINNVFKEPLEISTFPAGIATQQDIYSITVDGHICNTGSNWNSTYDSRSGTADYTTDTATFGTYCSGTTSFEIYRGFITFDTSIIPNNAYISSASLNIYISAKTSRPYIRIVRARHAKRSSLVGNDFGKCQYNPRDDPPKKLSEDTQIITTGSYKSIPLNLDGIAWINKRNLTKLGIRESTHDALRLTPSFGRGESVSFYTSNHTNSSYHPYLKVRYTIPEYIIENNSDDICEKNDREQQINGYKRTKNLIVNGDGSITECTSGGSDPKNIHWESIDDPVDYPDDDATKIYLGYTNNLWKTDLFTIAPIEGGGKIENVTVHYRARRGDGEGLAKACVKVGDDDPSPDPSPPDLTTSYDDYSYTWATNPNTGKAWIWSDIKNLQIGVMLRGGFSEGIRSSECTQVHATITFKNNLILGRDSDNNVYDLELRFNLLGVSQSDTFKYARLILAANEFNLADNDQLKLRITGQDIATTADFFSERPSLKTITTTEYVDWYINERDLPDDMRGIHLTQCILISPNLAHIINEIVGNENWGIVNNNNYIILKIDAKGSTSSVNNLIYLPDSNAGMVFNPTALELYKTTYDFFIAKEAVARITNNSALINCISLLSLDFYVEYRISETELWDSTPLLTNTTAGEPIEVTMGNLCPNTEYEYRIVYRETGNRTYSYGNSHTFHTQRASGEEFKFTIEADTHVRYSEKVVAGIESIQQLQLQDSSWDDIKNEDADFHINLGDWFEGRGGHCVTTNTAIYDYIKTRAYQGTRCWPTYFVLGNHEGENPAQDTFHTNARYARKKVIPNPDATVSTFYKKPNAYESHYAWEWGDAQFLVLDPFSYCNGDPDDDPWNWTLGKTQYDWLYNTLSNSNKKWKFVFIHHLVGGKSGIRNYARGGIEYAKYRVKHNATYEWGGEDANGNDVWSTKRPGWNHDDIHDMLKAQGVNVIFHGHDHGFVHQILDEIHYIECPTISGTSKHQLLYDAGFLEEARYEMGFMEGNNGYIRVTVNPDEVLIEYVGTIRAEDETDQGYANGEIRYATLLQDSDE